MARYVCEFVSKSLLRKTEVIIYIPTMSMAECMQCKTIKPYQEKNKKYPLMILLSGFSESKYAFESKSAVEELADEYNIALCMIGGENKWYLNGGPLEKWYDFINVELPDYLYGNFVNLSPELPKYICGVSMGGYGALYHYLNNVDSYKACCALSPATRPDGNLEEILKVKTLKELFIDTKNLKKNIYLSIGTKDFVFEHSKNFNDFLLENNVGVSYKFIDGYDHSWKLWRKEIVEFFRYIKTLE